MGIRVLGWLKRKSMNKGHFARLDAAQFPVFAPGSVWLVGAGPGAPGLITLLGYHALGQADVIVYDALVGPGLLDMANPKAEKIYAGKRGGKPSAKQADITLKLVEHARAGKRVLRLKGGDPMMFGRGGWPMRESPSPIATPTTPSYSSPVTTKRAASRRAWIGAPSPQPPRSL